MKKLRNPELRREVIWHILLTALCAAVGFMRNLWCGAAMLGAAAAFSAVHFVFLFRRYRKLEELNEMLDRVLHGQETFPIDAFGEGELAILSSEISKMTVRLREAAENLQKDKLRLTDLIADISHQLRTPMTAINLIVTMLSSEELSCQRRLELTRELKTLLARIDWLVESLLKMSKIDAGTAVFQHEPIMVTALVRKAAEPLAIPMEVRGQSLQIQVGQERFCGDFGWCAEAVGNLLKNCMEHTPAGGCICVDARETGIFTEISITDSGSGFDLADLPHLFERFYKGKNAAEGGFGIGLALCRMILGAQNGTVRAENVPDGGARFVIRMYKGAV